MKTKVRILVVAPYDGLEHLFRTYSKERDDVEVTTRIGDMLEGVDLVKNEDLSRYDVIISRAGTADLIRSVTDLPVIDIGISILDMMRTIKLALNYSGKFAIVGFRSITEQALLINELNNDHLRIRTITDISEINDCLNELKETGVGLIVGDVITTKHAKRFGLNTILVTSGVESVRNALAEAVKVHGYVRDSRNKQAFIRRIHDPLNVTVVSFGADGDVAYTNLEDDPERRRGVIRTLQGLAGTLESEGQLRVVKTIGDTQYVIEGKRLVFGEEVHPTFYLRVKPPVFHAGDKAVVFKNAGDSPQVKFEAFPTASPDFRRVIDLAKAYSETRAPILICGDKGTGKNMLAHAIYQNSPLRNNPMVLIDCRYMTEAKWTSLFESDHSPLLEERLTIYVRNLHFLNEKSRRLLETYLSQTQVHKRNRFIFTCAGGPEASDRNGLLQFIRTELAALPLAVPNLNQRKEDIPSLASLFLSELNPKYGKQVLGLHPDALERLRQFHWPHNIDQFKKVMEALIILTHDYYISAEEVESVLINEQAAPAVSDSGVIDLNKTLEEINRDIIEYVLALENHNYSKAAKRLGISRSTLWRKLK